MPWPPMPTIDICACVQQIYPHEDNSITLLRCCVQYEMLYSIRIQADRSQKISNNKQKSQQVFFCFLALSNSGKMAHIAHSIVIYCAIIPISPLFYRHYLHCSRTLIVAVLLCVSFLLFCFLFFCFVFPLCPFN